MKASFFSLLLIMVAMAGGCRIDSDAGRYQLHNFGEPRNEGVMMVDTRTGVTKLLYYRNRSGELVRTKPGLKFNEMPAD